MKKNVYFECEYCNKRFSRKASLKRHIYVLHCALSNETNKSYFECEYCNKRFPRKASLKRHIDVLHCALSNETNKSYFECEYCHKRFLWKSNLGRHIDVLHYTLSNEQKNTYFECQYYNERFTGKESVKSHINSLHCTLSNKTQKKCEYCNKKFASKSRLQRRINSIHYCTLSNETEKPCNLQRHVNSIQYCTLSNETERAYFECDYCNKRFPRKSSLLRHIISIHCTLPNETEKVYFNCEYCSRKKFSTKFNLKRHVERIHTPSVSRKTHLVCNVCGRKFYISPEKFNDHNCTPLIFECNDCGKTFKNRVVFVRHTRIHIREMLKVSENNNECRKFTCALCEPKYSYKKEHDIIKHYEVIHEVPVISETYSFQNENEFFTWKRTVEKNTACHYRRFTFYKVKRTGHKVILYQCFRSGFYKEQSKGIRQGKLLGSIKINGYCPSKIRVRINENNNVDPNSKYSVEFVSTHFGHDEDEQFFSSIQETQSIIREEWLLGVPGDKILKDNCTLLNNFPCTVTGNKYLNPKDIYNVAYSNDFNSFSNEDGTDSENVEAWIANNEDCVLYYKKRGSIDEKYPLLTQDDIILILMNADQTSMLQKFGNDVLMIDSTRGLNSYKLEMTVAMILDEVRQGYPTSFMFSSSTDEYTYMILFEKIKEKVGTLKPVLMSDVTHAFYNAWMNVMGAVEKRLYCAWHVHKNWRNNLCKINGGNGKRVRKMAGKNSKLLNKDHFDKKFSKKSEVLNTLYDLEKEMNPFKFHEKLSAFLNYKDEDLAYFIQYFKSLYADHYTTWAYCYRQYAGINTNIFLERFFRKLKEAYQYRRPKTLYESLIKLSDIALQISLDYKLKVKKLKLTTKLKMLRKIHKIHIKDSKSINIIIDQIQQISDNAWYVPRSIDETDDFNIEETYLVELVNPNCSCRLRCNDCNVCLHQYRCPCIVYSIQYQLCRHLHFIGQWMKKSSSSAKTNVEIMTTGENQNFISIQSYGENCDLLINEISAPYLFKHLNRFYINF